MEPEVAAATLPIRSRARRPASPTRGDRKSEMAATLQRVALDLFASQNYSTVTIKDISEATGVNPSLIYYYFGNKEDLFLSAVESVVEEAFAKFEQISEHSHSAEKIISDWIEIHILQFVLLQKLAKISLDYAGTRSRTARVDRAIRKFYDREAVVLGRAIRGGAAKGIFGKVDAKETATFISTFLDGALFRNVMFPSFDYAAAIAHMREVVMAHLKQGTAQS